MILYDSESATITFKINLLMALHRDLWGVYNLPWTYVYICVVLSIIHTRSNFKWFMIHWKQCLFVLFFHHFIRHRFNTFIIIITLNRFKCFFFFLMLRWSFMYRLFSLLLLLFLLWLFMLRWNWTLSHWSRIDWNNLVERDFLTYFTIKLKQWNKQNKAKENFWGHDDDVYPKTIYYRNDSLY